MGDYGSVVDWEDDRQEIYALRNKLGKFEDNDWRSIKDDGNPNEENVYEVTVEDEETGERYVIQDIYNPNNLFGFNINKEKGLNVVAWRNLSEPYDGE